METAEHLRQVAEYWRRLARLVTDYPTRRAIEKRADELDARAKQLEDGAGGKPVT